MKRVRQLLTILFIQLAFTGFSQNLPELQQRVNTAKTVKDKIYAFDALAFYYT